MNKRKFNHYHRFWCHLPYQRSRNGSNCFLDGELRESDFRLVSEKRSKNKEESTKSTRFGLYLHPKYHYSYTRENKVSLISVNPISIFRGLFLIMMVRNHLYSVFSDSKIKIRNPLIIRGNVFIDRFIVIPLIINLRWFSCLYPNQLSGCMLIIQNFRKSTLGNLSQYTMRK